MKYWSPCPGCLGQGRKARGISKKVRLRYRRALEEFEMRKAEERVGSPINPPNPPLLHHDPCLSCDGSGLMRSEKFPDVDGENFPHVAIIGAGIGGVALAVACLHRGIPFTIYERDGGFDTRSQGYGLTLQQASKAIEGLGVFSLRDGVISTRHVVHRTDGKMIGEWGIRKWLRAEDRAAPKRTNIHIARQSLRLALLEQLGGEKKVEWGHQLVDYQECEGGGVDLRFEVAGVMKSARADLLVGADGIRSAVRSLLIGEEISPLRYLGCIVILGICPLENLGGLESPLLDSATVFQTVNGNDRIYMMPYSLDSIMWQFSFSMLEDDAKALSARGAEALKEEACRRTQWHDPVPQIMAATQAAQVTGYPVYDRALLEPEMLEDAAQVTLIGDAAHPMSPFKGQGANQALLDALSLARGITRGCGAHSSWREKGIRETVLREFEAEMLKRSAVKVKDSAEAAKFLHSDVVLHEGDEPRGRCLKRE
jgi:salicylate hydroxylase